LQSLGRRIEAWTADGGRDALRAACPAVARTIAVRPRRLRLEAIAAQRRLPRARELGSAPDTAGPSTREARRDARRSEAAPARARRAALSVLGDDGVRRCSWGGSTPEYRAYHDTEWGFPVADDVRLFEKLSLEGFQAGLSWLTILRKREAFRRAFAGFDFEQVARFGDRDVERLLADVSIVRHRGKVEAVIANARRAVELAEGEGSLAAYVWRFEPDRRPAPVPLPAQTAESQALARDLKRRGWRFIGPTTAYAFMQAMGLVNDHVEGCDARAAVERGRDRFMPPGL
jgi:DNA-3-methyladenine glycosylase I